ncbi:hypothetical protein IKG38_00730 [Candidatus Saccharibacteria bacterium]|nr:hypothetical protein [Candidatus Saccharibacteria bacterium]
MKKDLTTAIGTALIGAIAAFFICNLFLGEIQPVEFKTVNSNITTNLTDPNPELFNYKALNPTVEVYVGDCDEVNQYGECIDEASQENQ